ncbi:sugar porter family MFS transporter [Sedimentisphaera salicampi]|uniref:D-xylose transporter n=1 Tax=Sedimentisphaera salicampi TaxID=1941349 RepID=A0A1W6LQJ6_9BACT|nr:sugar porter family MFS transporter [Sedimentisphaera salicampi]ARN57993.1 D-xylose transporter [Sedimentisphaera salicampi]
MEERNYNFKYVMLICIVASLGGFLFGFDISVISGTLSYLEGMFDLSGTSKGLVVASAIFGCVFGAGGIGKISDTIGRKKSLFLACLLLIISAIGSGWSNSISWFVFYRFIGGVGVGAASGVAPIYIAEVAPTKIRGGLVAFYQLAIVVGLSAAYVSNYFIELNTAEDSWRWMFTAEAVPGGLFLATLFFIPETPRFLVKIGKTAKAGSVLCKIENEQYASKEIENIKKTLAHVRKGSLKDLLEPRLLRIVIIGALLGVFSQISGVNAVLFYAPQIFEATGIEFSASLLQSTFIGLVFIIFSFIPLLLVDKAGRKKILLIGMACMAGSLAVISTFFVMDKTNSFGILIAVLCYVAAYAGSIASVTWIVLSEIFPNRIRAEAMAVANLCLWSANTLLTLTFPILEEKYGIQTPFIAYTVICVIIFFFVLYYIPETKGKSLEEIEEELVGIK